jgi:hypothetical protein
MRQLKQPIFVKLKSILGSIINLIVAGLLFPLLIIEIAADVSPGLIPPEIKSSIFQIDPPYKVLIPDKELGYKYVPDFKNYPVAFGNNQDTYTISTVSLGYSDIGFRDDGFNREPFAVVIGDSFANCAGVEMEACWVELLEERVDKDFANLSVLGYGPQQETRMLTKYGLPLKPKLVLWVFYANDLKDAWRFDQFGSGAARESEFWQNSVQTWLAQNSAVYTTLSFFWYNRFFFLNLLRDDNSKPRNPNISWWLASTDLTIPEVTHGFALTQAIILEAYRQTSVQHNETQFVVVFLPFREQVYANSELQPRFDHLGNSMLDFLQQNEVPVIDLTVPLREKAKAESDLIYFSEDIHLNSRGNEIVAELLEQELEIIFEQ